MVRNRRNVALLFAVYFLQGLCFYSSVATLYRLEAGLTLFQTGLLESISLAAMLLLEIPWGRAADRIGHRRTLVICSALFGLSRTSSPSGSSWPWLWRGSPDAIRPTSSPAWERRRASAFSDSGTPCRPRAFWLPG